VEELELVEDELEGKEEELELNLKSRFQKKKAGVSDLEQLVGTCDSLWEEHEEFIRLLSDVGDDPDRRLNAAIIRVGLAAIYLNPSLSKVISKQATELAKMYIDQDAVEEIRTILAPYASRVIRQSQ
ncbi:hypothetical protein CYMTET_22505, partial [Cymbomonas tetramitiformis]